MSGRKGYLPAYHVSGTLQATAYSAAIYTKTYDNLGFHIKWAGSSPADVTFVDGDVNTTSNVITITAHGLSTGVVGQLTTDGVLPGGLALSTNYYVISLTANTIKLASSEANALAGTGIDITSAAGGGTHTFGPTGSAVTGKFVIQVSNFPKNEGGATAITEVWDDLALDTATGFIEVTANTGTALISLNQLPFEAVRIGYRPTNGQGTYDAYVTGKEI